MVSVWQLIDLPLKGSKFTWRRNNLKSRIDGVFCDWVCMSSFLDMALLSPMQSFSNHNSLFFKPVQTVDWAPKPFRGYDDSGFLRLFVRHGETY